MTNLFQTGGNFYLRYLPGLLVSLLILFSSCGTTKTSSYFKNVTKDTTLAAPAGGEDLKIKKGDVLVLSISSLNKEEDEFFNSPNAGNIGGTNALSGYQVGSEGEIYLHKIGKLVVEGLTRKQLKTQLEDQLKPYLKDAIVVVSFQNHHVTLIGELGSPQILPLPEEKISIIDALAQGGRITENTQLNNIIVIRENNNKKELKHLNLEDHSIFNSPYYYLQPDDVVVVNPDEKRINQKENRESYRQIAGFVVQGLTAIALIYQVFFRN